MALGDCRVCQTLLENISDTTTRHLRAVSSLECAVRDDHEDARLASLRLHVSACSNERREALDRYRIHLSSHAGKAPGASY